MKEAAEQWRRFLPANAKSSEILEPADGALDLPAPLVAAKRTTVQSLDCNENGVPDECDIASGTSADCNGNGFRDECDIAWGISQDTVSGSRRERIPAYVSARSESRTSHPSPLRGER